MRSKDPEHTRRINRMRHTDTVDPVNTDLINTFQVLTEEDIQNDPSWKTAPVVVCSNDERYSINAIIVKNYAIEKGVPILTWVKDISNSHRFDATVCNVLYDTHPQLHGCFVQGAPAILLDNLNATSGLANGTPAILDSLLFKNNDDRLRVKRLLSNAQPGQIIQIPIPSAIIASFPTLNREEWKHLSLHDSIVKIPLEYKSHLKNSIKVGIKQYVNYKSHMIELAFAITYHKVQGQTMNKIILDLNKRPPSLKQLDFHAFYVGMTRVELPTNIRILPCQDDSNFKHLLDLKPNKNLKSWLNNIKQIL